MSEPEATLDPEQAHRIANGRTDLVRDVVLGGLPASTETESGVRLIHWCAYYGDVSAIDYLIGEGESLATLGDDLGLGGAAFHGHWRLCEYLLENGADVKSRNKVNGETALHAALGAAYRADHDHVVKVLLQHGAPVNEVTLHDAPTDSFMRDVRTRAETPLHRAAAFGSEGVVSALLMAGASREARDANGDTPLAWASWHRRPDNVLRALCYGPHTILEDRATMEENLRGKPLGGSLLNWL